MHHTSKRSHIPLQELCFLKGHPHALGAQLEYIGEFGPVPITAENLDDFERRFREMIDPPIRVTAIPGEDVRLASDYERLEPVEPRGHATGFWQCSLCATWNKDGNYICQGCGYHSRSYEPPAPPDFDVQHSCTTGTTDEPAPERSFKVDWNWHMVYLALLAWVTIWAQLIGWLVGVFS